MKSRGIIVGLATIAVMGLLMATVFWPQGSSLPEPLHDVAVEPPQSLATVNLIDHHKQAITLAYFKQKWTFLFVGFSHCAHICVPTLSQLALLKKALVKESALSSEIKRNLSFVFVSVDPDRDTPEHLADYMAVFDPEFVGMTGDEAAVLDFEKRLKAFHRVREDKRHVAGYDIDHSGEVFLIDPAARLVAKFYPPLDINKVVNQFRLFVSHFTAPALAG